MIIHTKTNFFKNAMGTMFLLAAAFFVCSTLVSMRSVFADPVAPIVNNIQKTGRTSPRSTSRTSNRTVARATVASRVANTAQNTGKTAVSRGVGTRKVSSRTITPTRAVNNQSSSRRVVSRDQKVANRSQKTSSRAVRARSAASNTSNTSRVSAVGSVMAGVRAGGTSYSYLSSKLYTGSYSDIVDSSTGLISADAYSNCMESYYTCMDEICTARSDTKGRCSCAGRAVSFLESEELLEQANEELIKLSGQLSLLIATKGKGDNLSAAFSLTEAEQVMNCVSWKEVTDKYGINSTEAQDWCSAHNIFASDGGTVSSCAKPKYCETNTFGFKVSDLNDVKGSSSDILAQLKAWADAKDLAKQYKVDDKNNLLSRYTYINDAVNSLSNVTTTNNNNTTDIDTLANKWGYKLFEYAHNNVCGRVLDSCFNGIYEACGTPVAVTDSDGKTHTKCGNGASSNCPFNYNSYIHVVDSGKNYGDVVLNERNTGNTNVNSSASCFGYSSSVTTLSGTRTTNSTTTDPYATLRGPVADARRSIMQKYLLDANAACDAYGAALKQTAQNINYQKIAAEQALQSKRLEFKQEEENQRFADAKDAIDNFNECISEIWDCYTDMADEEKTWTTARIKAYCAQVSNVPHCYETMICSPLQTQLVSVIDKADNTECTFSTEHKENNCRNVVTISEILYGTGVKAASTDKEADILKALNGGTTVSGLSSAKLREVCLQSALQTENGEECNSANKDCLRGWKKPSNTDNDNNSSTTDNENN
ncbi:MAG: hypothetical protein IKN73_00750 [Alphaproteobacteria bacterium]|nr:hypothetical protein [Alphaproteobacteria bacterium]